jgi:hypothetical protein
MMDQREVEIRLELNAHKSPLNDGPTRGRNPFGIKRT